MLSPDFLLRHALYASVAIGFVCPLVGVYLVLRRLVFLGVALPQISAAGIAFAYLLHTVGVHLYPHQEEEQPMALTGSILFVVAALIVLATLERRGRGLGLWVFPQPRASRPLAAGCRGPATGVRLSGGTALGCTANHARHVAVLARGIRDRGSHCADRLLPIAALGPSARADRCGG